jgi:hypothetical protein
MRGARVMRLAVGVLSAACSASSAGGGVSDAGDDGAAPSPDGSTDAPFDGSAAGGDATTEAGRDAGPPATYGPGIGADSLDNHQVADVDVDFRFRAATSSNLVGVRWYDIYTTKCAPHSGVDAGSCPADCPMSGNVYACGTGGTMHICIQTDDGTPAHLATGTDLGCVDHPDASAPPFFPLETFPSPPHLDQGALYHVHWHNIDPQPTVNFTSVDTLYVEQSTTPRQPTIADTDLAVFRGTTLRTQDTAIVELTYADGTVQGQGYEESWIEAAVNISGDARVRERFTVSGADRSVSSASVRLNRSSGASPLGVLVETASGQMVAQGTIPASAFPLAPIGPGTSATWASCKLGAFVLASGQTYHLVLSAAADTVFQAYGLERGDGYGFGPPTFFGDGYGELNLDGGAWAGLTQPGGGPDKTNADLQFFFE